MAHEDDPLDAVVLVGREPRRLLPRRGVKEGGGGGRGRGGGGGAEQGAHAAGQRASVLEEAPHHNRRS